MRMEVVQELTGRVLKITVEEEQDDFGREMLRYQNPKGILGAQLQWVNHMPQYLYEVGNRISLTEFFQKEPFTAGKLKKLLRQLIQLLKQAEEYFLDEKNMLLLAEYMFYDEKEGTLSVAYLDGYNQEIAEGISKILEQFMNTMNHRDKELVFLVYGLHKASRETNFCLAQLAEFVEEKEYPPKTISMREEVEKEHEMKKPEQLIHRPEHAPDKGVAKERGKERGKERALPVQAAGCLVVGILIMVAAFRSGLLQDAVSGEPDMKKAAVLILVLVLLAGYVLKREREKEKSEEKKSQSEDAEAPTMVLSGAGNDETVILERQERQSVYVNLIPEDWQRQEIHMRKSPVFIGKDATRADEIIKEGEISRLHAKFVMEEDGVYVIDQESTNGTYVNGDRLLPWERRQLKNDDKIAFSSIYYRVEMGS